MIYRRKAVKVLSWKIMDKGIAEVVTFEDGTARDLILRQLAMLSVWLRQPAHMLLGTMAERAVDTRRHRVS